MARITKDYADHNKDELLAEINARKADGRTFENLTMSTHKDDMIAALESDDEEKPPSTLDAAAKAADEQDAKDARIAELEAQLAAKPAAPGVPPVVNIPTGIDLDTYKDGEFKRINGGEEVFRLKIVKDDPIGRTHHLKNKEHYAELNEADFRAQFEKA